MKGYIKYTGCIIELAVPPTTGSLNSKMKEIKVLVLDTNPNLVVVIETW